MQTPSVSSDTAHAQHRLLLQLFLPGIDSSSLNYLVPGGGSSSSYGVRYSTPGQQQAPTSSTWQQSALANTGSQLVSPQYGQPIASARFMPVVNPAGSIIQPGMIERQLQPPTLAVLTTNYDVLQQAFQTLCCITQVDNWWQASADNGCMSWHHLILVWAYLPSPSGSSCVAAHLSQEDPPAALLCLPGSEA